MITKRILIVTMLALTPFIYSNAFASDLKEGGIQYRNHCAMCHGDNGSPLMAGAPDFRRGEGLLKPDIRLLDRIKSGKNACPSYLGILKDQQIFDVIAYIRTFY